jgi:hypothetical protein
LRMNISWTRNIHGVETQLFHVLRECHRRIHAALTLMNSVLSEFRWGSILSLVTFW